MHPVTNLDDILVDLLSEAQKTSLFFLYPVFHTLYNTGLRVEELDNLIFGTWLNPGQILVKSNKGSNPRIIDTSILLPQVAHDLGNNFQTFYIKSYDRYNEGMKKMLPFTLYTKSKPITTHLFRHNYIKKLYDDGMTLAQIKNHTGIKRDDTAQGYINSLIYTI